MTQAQFDQMRYEALPLINFVGGPLEGMRKVPPEANSTLVDPAHPEGKYQFFAGQYFWVTD